MTLVTKHGISIIFPAYNEEENIAKAVEQAIHCLELLFLDWEIIVVNDGSRDRTGQIIDGLAQQDSRIRVVHHGKNEGYGAALQSGIQRVHKELIFFCDSDLQFHLSELLLLLAWIQQYDIVIGYRFRRSDPFYRWLNALGWKTLVRLLLGLKVRDIDCAFKLFRSAVFRPIGINSVGAMVNTEILVQAIRMGFKIKEVPVTHFPRLNGKQTGASLWVILKAFKELFRLYHRLQKISPIFIQHDRRQGQKAIEFVNRRCAEQRRVMLPINFQDRRQRLFQTHAKEELIFMTQQVTNASHEHAKQAQSLPVRQAGPPAKTGSAGE